MLLEISPLIILQKIQFSILFPLLFTKSFQRLFAKSNFALKNAQSIEIIIFKLHIKYINRLRKLLENRRAGHLDMVSPYVP